MKTVLITGGAGFLGSHLCTLFLTKGFRVICVDNFITGMKKNIEGFLPNKRFRLIEHDITIPLKIKGSVDYILHFASPASPIDYLAHPIKTLKVGSLGTHNCLGLAKAKKAVFLLASTSEIYGDPVVHPQKESYWGHVNPVGPRGVYDEAKRFAEAITMAYHREHKVNTRIVRIFNTYGPHMRIFDGRAIPNFLTQALKNETISIYGMGQQTRSFCYVDDLMKGIYKLLMSSLHDPVNIGNPTEITINELVRSIISLTKSDSLLTFKPLPVDDPCRRQPDIARAKKYLKWKPTINLKEGLIRTIKWFRANIT